MSNIAVVVPTIRPAKYKEFLDVWGALFEKHNIKLLTIYDGKDQYLEHKYKKYTPKELFPKYTELFYNYTSACKNLGFAYIWHNLPDVEYVIVLDDDVEPVGDPIGDHLELLECKTHIDWMSVGNKYTRGFPYSIRDKTEIVLSHGIWFGKHDYDAPTQLTVGNPEMEFRRTTIPKGVLYPMSGMNLAFKRKLIPYMYFSQVPRFDDIWAGIVSKREIDKQGWAVVTGYSSVNHKKASNVFDNLIKEAPGIKENETLDGPMWKEYLSLCGKWRKFCA